MKTQEKVEVLDQVITRQTSEATPLSVALFAACNWLKRHPKLTADPDTLLEFVSAYIVVAKPTTPELARQAGVNAVKECAGCKPDCKLHDPEVIEPEDLME